MSPSSKSRNDLKPAPENTENPGGNLDEEKLQAEQEAMVRELSGKIFGGRKADDHLIASLLELAAESNSTLDDLIDRLRRLA